LGLDIMRERATQIGADLRFETAPGQGTTVIVRWTKESDASINGE
jgi:nitrate/nitrite-specific signal transduction histidine kinase